MLCIDQQVWRLPFWSRLLSSLAPFDADTDVAGSAIVLISDRRPPVSAEPERFRRGDANVDGRVDISDPMFTLSALFVGDQPLSCGKAADANDDGSVNLTDAVFMLGYLFNGRQTPPAPHDQCGVDLTADDLNCSSFPSCP